MGARPAGEEPGARDRQRASEPPRSEGSTTDEVRLALARLRAGDVEAFAVLVRRYQGEVWRIAQYALGDRASCEDLVQQTNARPPAPEAPPKETRDTGATSETGRTATNTPDPRAPWSRRKRAVVLTLVGLNAALVGAILMLALWPAQAEESPTCEITITSVPSGAEVRFGTSEGQLIGRTPVTFAQKAEGRRMLTIHRPGYQRARAFVQCPTQVYALRLAHARGR